MEHLSHEDSERLDLAMRAIAYFIPILDRVDLEKKIEIRERFIDLVEKMVEEARLIDLTEIMAVFEIGWRLPQSDLYAQTMGEPKEGAIPLLAEDICELCHAIIAGNTVSWKPDNPLLGALRQVLPANHLAFKHIVVVG